MDSAFERVLAPSTERPQAEEVQPKLNVFVVFTSIEATLAALKTAGNLAVRLDARIMLLAPQVVPYPLPLNNPPVSLEWNKRRLRLIAGQSQVETTLHVYLCRDRWQTLESVLSAHSLVVLGGRRLWWSTPESRLARKLRQAGHEVILMETE
ncbi:MAG TPA: hypothetical protein VH639_08885 [Bryobacteraceae bacterium]|jgi:hypothetical protein